jgi:hypothetical protein
MYTMKLSTNEVTLIGFVGGDAKQKETKKAKDVDVAWLKDYAEPKK